MLIDRYHEAVEALLKTVRETQRENIEKAGEIVANAVETGHKIYLELRVKVLKNWRNDETLLRQMGIISN